MTLIPINKKKIINDPVYGFIAVPDELLFDIIEHPYFQRLRRIKQLGLTDYVYPSATHTRFQHALGCLYLMVQAVQVLRSKNIDISREEAVGVWLAILLHDIGHGPYSHTLEKSIVTGVTHEELSLLFMKNLNRQFGDLLDTAIRIYTNTYPKRFLHQLVSSQLDMDRLDYLSRDSFFTGVAEGVINTDRIINMLTVVEDELVVEEKGIYSIEKFIIARRLMYWQVYLHKAALAADSMLVNIFRRAKYLSGPGTKLFSTPALQKFLCLSPGEHPDMSDPLWLQAFSELDDHDIVASLKVWATHPDPVLSNLCTRLIHRHLFRIEIQRHPFEDLYVNRIREMTVKYLGLSPKEAEYFLIQELITNNAYTPQHDKIKILTRQGEILDIPEASEQLNICLLSTPTNRYLLGHLKEVDRS